MLGPLHGWKKENLEICQNANIYYKGRCFSKSPFCTSSDIWFEARNMRYVHQSQFGIRFEIPDTILFHTSKFFNFSFITFINLLFSTSNLMCKMENFRCDLDSVHINSYPFDYNMNTSIYSSFGGVCLQSYGSSPSRKPNNLLFKLFC